MDKVRILKEWETDKLRPSRALVHTIRGSYLGLGSRMPPTPLLTNPAADLFRGWDVVSASLVDLNRMSPAEADLSADTMAFGELVLVLDVPIQNILGTHARDTSFPNHIGTLADTWAKPPVKNSYALVDAINSGQTKHANRKVAGGFNQICTPSELLGRSARIMSNYNEVLLVGKPDVNIYQGLKPTGLIRVCDVMVFFKSKVGQASHLKRQAELVMVAQKIMAINNIPGAPTII